MEVQNVVADSWADQAGIDVGKGVTTLCCFYDVKKLGMTLVAPPKRMEVQNVVADSWADQAGIQVGDSFSEINGTPAFMLTPREFNVEIRKRPLTLRMVTNAESSALISIQCVVRAKLARHRVDRIVCLRKCWDLFGVDDALDRYEC